MKDKKETKKRRLSWLEADICWCHAGAKGSVQCKDCRRNRANYEFDGMYSSFANTDTIAELAERGECPHYIKDDYAS